MSEPMIFSTPTDKQQDGFGLLMRASKALKTEVERLRQVLYETRVITGGVFAQSSHKNTSPTTNHQLSTLLITVLLQKLLERNEHIEFLHKQLAANTKRMAELNEQARKDDQKATYLGNKLNQIFAEIGYSTNAPEPRAVESLVQRLVGALRNLQRPKLRLLRRRRRSIKKRYGIR